jgi:hypothetical protein
MQSYLAILKKSSKKHNIIFSMFLVIFWILGVYLLKYYQYSISGQDLISVISIGQLYAEGDLHNAINGYWGPLFSWLLVPFLLFKSSQFFALYSTKILSLIIGFFTLIGIRFLSYRFEMDEKIRLSILFLMIFVVLYFSLIPSFFPMDLLLLCFLVYYLYFIFDPNYSDKLFNGFVCGILGAMAYLTKEYALPFFIVHFVLFNMFHYVNDISRVKRRKILKNFAIGIVVFIIIAGAWSAVISDKYGKITTGTAGQYNYELVGPNSQGIPMWNGFMKPTNDKAITTWEDPSYDKLINWSSFHSVKNFIFQLTIIGNNIIKTIGIIQTFSIFAILILIAYIVICIQPPRKLISDTDYLYPLTTILLFIGGYILVFVEFRYLILVNILLILMGGYLINKLFKKTSLIDIGKIVLIILFISSFILLPVTSITQGINQGMYIYDLSNILSNQYNIHGNLASNGENSQYYTSEGVAYFLNSQYYGTNLINWKISSDSELENNFIKYKIDYYLLWDNSTANINLLSKYKEVTNGTIAGLKVYAINGR